MKKLILLLNDYPSTGKSTLARCFSNYLSRFGVSHQLKTLVEETESDDEDSLLDASRITPRSFLQMVADSPITVLEVATGQGDFFKKFYTNHALDRGGRMVLAAPQPLVRKVLVNAGVDQLMSVFDDVEAARADLAG
jgi:hypothetical protein